MSPVGFDKFLTSLPEGRRSGSLAGTSRASDTDPSAFAVKSGAKPTDRVLVGLRSGAMTMKDIIPLTNNSLDVALETVNMLKSLGFASMDGDKVNLTDAGNAAAALIQE
ncbi:MAG TPA: hypothetical protein VGM17_02650 [Rhizomicrobium sp.]